uniref:Uncharacterized protein n=1 Tax=Parascaris equorum TaxID=6256 RepID=A0A914RJX0_PAREQ
MKEAQVDDHREAMICNCLENILLAEGAARWDVQGAKSTVTRKLVVPLACVRQLCTATTPHQERQYK